MEDGKNTPRADLGDTMLSTAADTARTATLLESASKALLQASAAQDSRIEAILGRIEAGVADLRSFAADADRAAEAMDGAAEAARRGKAGVERLSADAEVIFRQTASSAAFLEDLRSTIGKIVGAAAAIKDIAEDLSVIAINTAIEAARAGEKGKGFAVLAREIRKLAERSGGLSDAIAADVVEAGSKLDGVRGSVADAEASSRSAAESASGFAREFDHIAGGTERAGAAMGRFRLLAHDRLESEQAIARMTGEMAAEGDTIVERSRETAEAAALLRKSTERTLASLGSLRTGSHDRALAEAGPCAESLAPVRLERRDELNGALKAVFARSEAFELLYVLDAAGRQVSDNIVNPARRGSISEAGYGADRSDREYYRVPFRTKEPYHSPAYLSSASGSLCITVSIPLLDAAGSVRGIFAADMYAADAVGCR